MLVLLELNWKKLNSVLLFSLFSNISKTNKSTFVTLLKFGNDTPVGNHWIDKYYVTNRKCENRYKTNFWLQFFKWYNLMIYDCNKIMFGLCLLNQCICFTFTNYAYGIYVWFFSITSRTPCGVITDPSLGNPELIYISIICFKFVFIQ